MSQNDEDQIFGILQNFFPTSVISPELHNIVVDAYRKFGDGVLDTIAKRIEDKEITSTEDLEKFLHVPDEEELLRTYVPSTGITPVVGKPQRKP